MMKKILSCLTFFAILTGIIFGIVAWQSYRFWLQKPSVNLQDCTQTSCTPFSVQSGEGMKVIAARLKEERLIAHSFWFLVYAKLDGSARSVQAGEYLIPTGMNYAALTDLLQNADRLEITVTIPEGLTISQIGAILERDLGIEQSAWLEIAKESEGMLFPSTYRFFPDASAQEVYDRLKNEMQTKLSLVEVDYATLSPQVKNEKELLTVASILEKEVRSKEDMEMVADIIYKRLALGMPLQMDSTVNFLTGGTNPSIALADRDIDSPYNTYKYAGLPPGPIANPGLNALRAAAHPKKNDYYYFLTSPSGTVYYAKTFEEHIENRRYLR